jgi:hypothetical protein
VYGKKKDGHEETLPLAEYDLKGWKAVGSKLSGKDVSAIELLQKEDIEEEEMELDIEDDGDDENTTAAPQPDPILDELLKSRPKTPPSAPTKTEQSKLFDL